MPDLLQTYPRNGKMLKQVQHDRLFYAAFVAILLGFTQPTKILSLITKNVGNVFTMPTFFVLFICFQLFRWVSPNLQAICYLLSIEKFHYQLVMHNHPLVLTHIDL